MNKEEKKDKRHSKFIELLMKLLFYFPWFKNEKVMVFSPKSHQAVGRKFVIKGIVPLVWLKSKTGIRNSISLDIIDINGRAITGTSIFIDVSQQTKWFLAPQRRFIFYRVYEFSELSFEFLKESRGRMTIKLSGENERQQSVYVPINVKYFNQENNLDKEIVKRHDNIGKTIRRYEKDLDKYYKAMEKIRIKRLKKNSILKKDDDKMDQYISDWNLSEDMLNILGKADHYNNNYPFKQEDQKEEKLAEKYKDALVWQGPLFGAVAGRLNGFEFRIYSGDHGKHFHVIHREKGINARFSFPEIELINYKKAKTSINRREINSIKEYFSNNENFKRIEKEFKHRENK